jgi:predicted Ser/Thr protein kinase
MNIALNLALTALRILLSYGILSRIETMVRLLVDAPRLPDETDKQYNDRRRNYVVEQIKSSNSDVRTALIEAAIGVLVYKVNPR